MTITIKRAIRHVDLCTDLSLVGEHEQLNNELLRLEKSAGGYVSEAGDPKNVLSRQISELEEKMRESTLTFSLQALPRAEFKAWEDASPAREGNNIDAQFGVDVSKINDLIPLLICGVKNKATGKEVDFSASGWPDLSADLSDGQWEDFALVALNVNRGIKSSPFSQLAKLHVTRGLESD